LLAWWGLPGLGVEPHHGSNPSVPVASYWLSVQIAQGLPYPCGLWSCSGPQLISGPMPVSAATALWPRAYLEAFRRHAGPTEGLRVRLVTNASSTIRFTYAACRLSPFRRGVGFFFFVCSPPRFLLWLANPPRERNWRMKLSGWLRHHVPQLLTASRTKGQLSNDAKGAAYWVPHTPARSRFFLADDVASLWPPDRTLGRPSRVPATCGATSPQSGRILCARSSTFVPATY